MSERIKKDLLDAKFLKANKHKMVKDLPSEAYHGLMGTFSSSQLKDILEDEEVFIKKHVTKEIERETNEAFDTGTYLHTSILEPHKLKHEIVVYEGKRRYGKDYDAFMAKHKGKVIITTAMKESGDRMVKAVKASPTALEYLEGDPEVSLFTEIVVWCGRIYAPHYGKMLTLDGWVDSTAPVELKGGYRIVIKVRADMLGETFISDLKSTSSNARKERDIRDSISKYKYDLSAALYLDMFTLARPKLRHFVWIFASKTANNSGTWRATKNQIKVGRAKWMRAMCKIADCAQAKWELVDCLREAEPLPWEMEWLREKDTDLL